MPRSLHPLEFLSEFFDTVEINSSFYHPPQARYAASWVEKVTKNPRFKFTAKLWQRFTHERQRRFSAEDVRVFEEGVRPLVEAGRLGGLLLQYPWSFKRTRENRAWLAEVTDAFADYPLVVEFRHTSWDVPEVHAALTERGIAFCNIDQPIFADCIEPAGYVTAPLAYVRLHGRNRANWFREAASRDERYDYLYTGPELAMWVDKVEKMRKLVDELYVITNNHYRGQAVVNALELQERFGASDYTIPGHLIGHYPRLGKQHE